MNYKKTLQGILLALYLIVFGLFMQTMNKKLDELKEILESKEKEIVEVVVQEESHEDVLCTLESIECDAP